MKKNISKILTLVILMVMMTTQTADAQVYHSKPTAIKNLSEEAVYVTHQMETELEEGSDRYIAASEKLRFMKQILRALKKEESVQSAGERLLPKYNLHELQPAVKYFDASYANTTPNRYIRNEILYLIAY